MTINGACVVRHNDGLIFQRENKSKRERGRRKEDKHSCREGARLMFKQSTSKLSLTRLRTASHVAREQMLLSQIARAQPSCVKRAISRSTAGSVQRCEVISRKVL